MENDTITTTASAGDEPTVESLKEVISGMLEDMDVLLEASTVLLDAIEYEDAYKRNYAIGRWVEEANDAGNGSSIVFNALTNLGELIDDLSRDYDPFMGSCQCNDCND